jgi:hypothetical protein
LGPSDNPPVFNGKRKSSAETDGLDYLGYNEDSVAAKRSKGLKGSPDSPPLQGSSSVARWYIHLQTKKSKFWKVLQWKMMEDF